MEPLNNYLSLFASFIKNTLFSIQSFLQPYEHYLPDTNNLFIQMDSAYLTHPWWWKTTKEIAELNKQNQQLEAQNILKTAQDMFRARYVDAYKDKLSDISLRYIDEQILTGKNFNLMKIKALSFIGFSLLKLLSCIFLFHSFMMFVMVLTDYFSVSESKNVGIILKRKKLSTIQIATGVCLPVIARNIDSVFIRIFKKEPLSRFYKKSYFLKYIKQMSTIGFIFFYLNKLTFILFTYIYPFIFSLFFSDLMLATSYSRFEEKTNVLFFSKYKDYSFISRLLVVIVNLIFISIIKQSMDGLVVSNIVLYCRTHKKYLRSREKLSEKTARAYVRSNFSHKFRMEFFKNCMSMSTWTNVCLNIIIFIFLQNGLNPNLDSKFVFMFSQLFISCIEIIWRFLVFYNVKFFKYDFVFLKNIVLGNRYQEIKDKLNSMRRLNMKR